MDRAALYAMPALTPLSREQLEHVLRAYVSVGTAASTAASTAEAEAVIDESRCLHGGLSNTNYYVRTRDGREWLCKVCDEKSRAEVVRQVRALLLLKRIGAGAASAGGAPPLLAAFSKHPIGEPAGVRDADLDDADAQAEAEAERCVLRGEQWGVPRPIVVYDFLRGRPPTAPPSARVLQNLARGQARLHLAPPARFAFLPPFPMGLAQMRPFLHDEVPHLPDAVRSHPFVAFLRDQIAKLATIVERTEADDEGVPQGVLHGDLFLENAMFEGDELVGLIDFEEMCIGPVALDVAMTIVGCCYDEQNQLNLDLARAFLCAYQSCRPLTRIELRDFPHFFAYALLSIAFWRFRQFHVRAPDAARQHTFQIMVDRMHALPVDALMRMVEDNDANEHDQQ